MNAPLRLSERQSSTAGSWDVHTLVFAAIGGALGAVVLLLWLHFGWWALAFIACIAASAVAAKLLARVELRRLTRRLEYQRRTPYEAGVGRNLDVEA